MNTAKQDKFDWKLVVIIVLYMLRVGLTFFLFNNVKFEKLGMIIVLEIISAIIIAVIAAILSIGHISRCLIGVFVWMAGIFALFFLEYVDGFISSETIGTIFLILLVEGLGLAAMQLVSYGIVKPIGKAVEKK